MMMAPKAQAGSTDASCRRHGSCLLEGCVCIHKRLVCVCVKLTYMHACIHIVYTYTLVHRQICAHSH
jgi:hypothetical protein